MTTTSSINPDKLTSDLTNSGNFWIWKAKIYMNLGKFGEAGEELRSENRFIQSTMSKKFEQITLSIILKLMMVQYVECQDLGILSLMNQLF